VHFSGVSTVLMAAVTYMLWAETAVAPVRSLLTAAGLVGVGLMAALGQLLQTCAYAVDRAARVGATGWLQVLLAVPIDIVLLGTPLRSSALLGIGLMVVAGVILMLSVWHEPDPTCDELATRKAKLVDADSING
jgi:drug/metabolite transporter (DMT)-like permease